jgi:UDP-3-O-[3-hydroxymyristoyl] N-acetylglucosamine deacetylase
VRLQRTLKKELVFRGRGLHTGKFVVMRLKPAARDTGIVFYRSDKGEYINANVNSVSDTAFATTLGSNGTRVKTVEHVLAAVAGLGIDNVIIDVNASEVPILDGSSEGFVQRILAAGIAQQASNRHYIRVTQPVFFKEGQAEVAVFPYEGTKISYQICFSHCLLGEQKMTVEVEKDVFTRELAPARTFGFLKDVEYLKALGLAKGGSLDNAVILTERGVLNASGLRFEDEFIRHKILDFIGDIALVGFPVQGHFVVSRSGHTSNVKFIRHLLSSPDCWQVVSGVDASLKATA